MDDWTGEKARIPNYNRDRNDFKRDFVEKWLVNMAPKHDNNIHYRQYESTSSGDTLPSGSPRSSYSDYWEVVGTERAKKKASKLQFLNALKNIFKRKKGEYFSDEVIGVATTESTINIMSIDDIPQIIEEEAIKTATLQPMSGYSFTGYDSDYSDDLQESGSQPTPEQKMVRLGAMGASIKKLNALEQFNRGFSEIIQTQAYGCSEKCERLAEEKGVKNEIKRVTKDRKWPERKSELAIFRAEPTAIGDSWNVEAVKSSSRRSLKLQNDKIEQKFRVPRQKSVNQADSYLNKVELIKTLFGTASSKGEPQNPKSPPPVRLFRTKSRILATTSSSAFTKDLIEAPYLREHDRLMWQGKNKELWFRINALYNKYYCNGRINDCNKKDTTAFDTIREITSPHKVTCVNQEKISSDNEITNRIDSFFQPRKKRTESSRTGRSLILPFGSNDTEGHVKLEEIFITEHIRNRRKTSRISPGPVVDDDPIITKLKCKACNRPRIQGWHLALEQVRASMQKMSDDCLGKKKPTLHPRCRSKISVAFSSDWEDISTASICSSNSGLSLRLLQPIPCTPSFKHYIRPNIEGNIYYGKYMS